MAESSPTLLVSPAAEFSKAIFRAIKRKRLRPSDLDCFRVAGEVATKLHLISTYIDSLPPYWIEPEVEQLSFKILGILRVITQPAKGSSFLAFTFNWREPTDQETQLVAFFNSQKKDALILKHTCDDLLGKLTKEDNSAVALPDSALKLNAPASSDDFNSSVFKALQSIASCDPKFHPTSNAVSATRDDSPELRHPARLCLHETENQALAPRNVSILVSAIDMTMWQEFFLRMQQDGTVDDERQILKQGGFCPILEQNYAARLILELKRDRSLSLLRETQVLNQIFQAGPGASLKSVICHYELTAKDKVILSYAVAQSYWKYYDSGLMQIQWTSDAIWFMSEEGKSNCKGRLPLRAYLSLPSDIAGGATLDVVDEDLLNHRCPRIFGLAVLLLEIGLAKPFRILERHNKVAQANLNHKRATDELLELTGVDWEGFTNKKYFDSAVKFCLNRDNFIPPKDPKQTRQGVVESAPVWYGKEGIPRRKKMLYENVVRPLKWLAEKGFKVEPGDLTYISKKSNPSPQTGASNTEPEALFHSNLIPNMWLADLKKINEYVERKRRAHQVTTPVRVAILDTGINKDFTALEKKNGQIKSITDEKDFVDPSTPNTMDTFGHGTFMARLIMECAPGVEILVVRVAKNTGALQSSTDNIKEAILWAGQTSKADIISMSFGFPRDDQGICDAIETVYKNREENVIFFASAGNLSTDDESFPARHPNVISVQATNCHGTFLQSNSASTTNGAAVLGTYGDDIPDFIREEFSTVFPKVCQPGSSVATAIMAGIGATMLAYASVLPSIVSLQGVAASTGNRVLKRLRTAKGMEAVLHRLAQENHDHPRLKAVKPMWFWKSRPSDTERYSAIIDTLSDVDRRAPRTT